MNDPSNKRRLIPIVLGTIVLASVLWLLTSAPSDNGQTQTLTPPNPQPSAVTAPKRSYPGAEILLNRGLTTRQIEAFKKALDKHFEGTNTDPKTVQISGVEHVRDRDADVGTHSMFMTLTIDNVPFKARLDYFELYDVRLYLFDQANVQVFDSGIVKG